MKATVLPARVASARPTRARNGKTLDAAEFLRVLLPELAQFHQQREPLVALLLLGRALEQAEIVHFLGFGINLAVLAQGGVERLQLHDGLLFQLDVVVHFGRGIEIVDIDTGRGRPMRLTRPTRCMRRVEFHGVS